MVSEEGPGGAGGLRVGWGHAACCALRDSLQNGQALGSKALSTVADMWEELSNPVT